MIKYFLFQRYRGKATSVVDKSQEIKIRNLLLTKPAAGAAEGFRGNIQKGCNVFLRDIFQKVSIILKEIFVFSICTVLTQEI